MSVADERIEHARRFIVLRAGLGDPWDVLAQDFLERGDFLLGLALLDPTWWSGGGPDTFPDPRGPRASTVRPASADRCQSARVWGYDCGVPRTDALQADHLFPFDSGGPTDPRNTVFLCTWHNRVKSSDVHLFPWEEGEPVWLRDALSRVGRRIRTAGHGPTPPVR